MHPDPNWWDRLMLWAGNFSRGSTVVMLEWLRAIQRVTLTRRHPDDSDLDVLRKSIRNTLAFFTLCLFASQFWPVAGFITIPATIGMGIALVLLLPISILFFFFTGTLGTARANAGAFTFSAILFCASALSMALILPESAGMKARMTLIVGIFVLSLTSLARRVVGKGHWIGIVFTVLLLTVGTVQALDFDPVRWSQKSRQLQADMSKDRFYDAHGNPVLCLPDTELEFDVHLNSEECQYIINDGGKMELGNHTQFPAKQRGFTAEEVIAYQQESEKTKVSDGSSGALIQNASYNSPMSDFPNVRPTERMELWDDEHSKWAEIALVPGKPSPRFTDEKVRQLHFFEWGEPTSCIWVVINGHRIWNCPTGNPDNWFDVNKKLGAKIGTIKDVWFLLPEGSAVEARVTVCMSPITGPVNVRSHECAERLKLI